MHLHLATYIGCLANLMESSASSSACLVLFKMKFAIPRLQYARAQSGSMAIASLQILIAFSGCPVVLRQRALFTRAASCLGLIDKAFSQSARAFSICPR